METAGLCERGKFSMSSKFKEIPALVFVNLLVGWQSAPAEELEWYTPTERCPQLLQRIVTTQSDNAVCTKLR